MVGQTFDDVLKMERPLTVEKMANYVKKWFDEEIAKGKYITRSGYNKTLNRKINATVRVLKAISPSVDVVLETRLRQEISQKCVIDTK